MISSDNSQTTVLSYPRTELFALTPRDASSRSSLLTQSATKNVRYVTFIFYLELLDFILKRTQPLEEDYRLYGCYRGVKEDLAQLKREGWVREFNRDGFKELQERLQKGGFVYPGGGAGKELSGK